MSNRDLFENLQRAEIIFESICIVGLLSASVHWFATGEPWLGLASLALMNWFRY